MSKITNIAETRNAFEEAFEAYHKTKRALKVARKAYIEAAKANDEAKKTLDAARRAFVRSRKLIMATSGGLPLRINKGEE